MTGLNIVYIFQIFTETMSAICNSIVNVCMLCDAQLEQTNTSTTKCGHTFCLTCLITYMETSYECPECAALMPDSSEVNPELTCDDESIEWYDLDSVGCIDDVAKMLENDNVTMLDVLIYYSGRRNSQTGAYRPSHRHDYHIYYIERMEEIIQNAFNEVDRIHRTRESCKPEHRVKLHDE